MCTRAKGCIDRHRTCPSFPRCWNIAVARQFVTYLDANCLLPSTESGFRRVYSTETAIIRVLSDLLDAVDRDDTAMFVLLDLSAAFDTVDHGILLERLQVTFGVDNSALAWFRSYLAGRRQYVR